MIDPAVIRIIQKDWQDAPRGAKTKIVRKWADLTGLSYSRLYAQLNTGRARKRGGRKIHNIEEQAMIVAQIKKRPPAHRGEITTEDAIEIARSNGYGITASHSSIDRVIREIGAAKKPRRVVRYQADYPNQLHHVDASSSNCFYVARESGGEIILKLHTGYKGYKNKPVPLGLRPWLYGVVDDYSGYHIARYIAADGESAIDNLNFLCWAWAQKEGCPFCGLPDFIKGDHGPMMKSKEVQFFFDNLAVAVDPSTPGNKDAHGKIERPWRTLWQRFELPFFAEDLRSFEISLNDLNRRLMNYCLRYNKKRHRFNRRITREQAWLSINRHGGVVALPENAMQNLVRRYERQVDNAGCFSIDNKVYEVKGLHSSPVWVYSGVFDDKMVVECRKTREKYECVPFEPLGFDEFKAQPETGHQKAAKAAEELTLTNTLHDEAPEKTPVNSNIAAFPSSARVRECREPVDVRDCSSYSTLEDAMTAFITLTGMVPDPETRAELADLMTENKLNRQFVNELAADVTANMAAEG